MWLVISVKTVIFNFHWIRMVCYVTVVVGKWCVQKMVTTVQRFCSAIVARPTSQNLRGQQVCVVYFVLTLSSGL